MSDESVKLSLRIDEERDVSALQVLAEHAARHGDREVQALRFKAINKMRRLRNGAGSGGPHFAAPYGIMATRDIALHGYRLEDEAFARLQADVVAMAAQGRLEQGYCPALFVLWAADWFRRCYRGDGLKWEALMEALGASIEQIYLRDVTEKGLRHWHRPFKTSEGDRRYFLGTLAREGGFPVAAVEQGGKGWARDMLAGIVAPLLADPSAGRDEAERFARHQQGRITARLFQDAEFALLCADLALAIAQVRRQADGPAQAAGLPVAAWLQQHRPDWKDDLPLSVTGQGADALLGELLMVEAAAVTGLDAGVERLLVRGEDSRWQEAARLTLDGRMEGAVMRGIDPQVGRLRLFAAGPLARVVPGELGLLDPPGQGEHGWTARSRRHVRAILPIPFATVVEVELRSGERWVGRVLLPRGKARRGQLLVCSVAKGSITHPEQLKVEASGSGQFKAEAVVIQVPADWRVLGSDDGASEEHVAQIGAGVGETWLWQVQGGAFVIDPQGDCYRIRTGQTRDRRDRLDLYGDAPRWAQVEGDVDLFLGIPTARPGDPGRGDVVIRPIGTREWRRAPSTLPVGHYDIGWRGGRSLLDRRRIAVLPASAELERSGMGRDTRYSLTGWEAVALMPAADAPVRAVGDSWIAKPPATTRPTFWFDATLTWPDGASLSVRIDYPAAASIARWDGSLLPGGARVTLADLRDLVAVDRGEMRLFGELMDGRTRGAASAMAWQFRGDMPLSSASADIASLLLPASGDAEIKLGMLGYDSTSWHVRQFALRLDRQGGGLVASHAIVAADAQICGRSLADPSREICFGSYSLLVDANHRPFTLPEDVGGGWIVYLRDGETVLSRPEVIIGHGAEPRATTQLTRAMQVSDWRALNSALHEVLIAAAEDDSIIRELNGLAASLDGVHPWYVLVLRLLPDHPIVLARMAFAAAPEQRDAVLALAVTLPFAWCLIPKSCWQAVVDKRVEQLLMAMQAVEGATAYAMQAVAGIIATLCDREPLLEPVLKDHMAVTPRDAVIQTFLNTAAERLDEGRRGSRYRQLGLTLPDDHLRRPDHCLETLDTPHAAALAVAGAWTPQADDVRHIKSVARNFPTFFADAFAAALKET